MSKIKALLLVILVLGALLVVARIEVANVRSIAQTNCELIRDGRINGKQRAEILKAAQEYIIETKPVRAPAPVTKALTELETHEVVALPPPVC
jgi:hypothetical protein